MAHNSFDCDRATTKTDPFSGFLKTGDCPSNWARPLGRLFREPEGTMAEKSQPVSFW